jgi:predicted nuclease of predicted toxin-antitoxin system
MREYDFTVVSKDADFSEISMQLGYPPKLLWLRIANWTTADIEDLLRSKSPLIAELPNAPGRGSLALFKKRAD